jgi:hypothetical protein
MERAATMPIFLTLYQYYSTPIQNNKALAASSFKLTLFNYTPLAIMGTGKKKQLTIVKPTQNGNNCNKSTFCVLKSLEPLKNSKSSRGPYLGQVL